jgi:hypothetical protein
MAQGKSNLLVLFDIDGTLTVPRQSAKEDMLATLRQLRQLNPKPLAFYRPPLLTRTAGSTLQSVSWAGQIL